MVSPLTITGILLMVSVWMHGCVLALGYEHKTRTVLVEPPSKKRTSLWQLQGNSSHCSSNKRCRCFVSNHSRVADCSGLNISTLPVFHRNVTVIYLQGNHIHNFKRNVIKNDTTAISMFSARRREESVSPFSEMNQLEYLDLSNNSLEYLPSVYTGDVFKGLKQLKYLNLKQNNDINDVDNASYPDSISDLSSLEILLLDGIDEKGFPKVYLNLRYLKTLDISGNMPFGCRLDIVRSNYFSNTPYVENLTMSNCNLKFIENGTFQHLKNLKMLNISDNNYLTFEVLSNISYDLQFTSIDELDVSRIHCTFGPGTLIFKNDVINLKNTNLTRFHLEGNRLTMFEEGTFSVLPESLKVGWVGYNKFTFGVYVLQSKSLKNLEILYGSNQFFSDVPTTGRSDCNDWRAPHSSSHITHFPKATNNFQWNNTDKFKLKYFSDHLSNFRTKTLIKQFYLPPFLKEVHYSKSSLHYEVGEIPISPNNVTYIDFSDNFLHSWIGPLKNMQNLRHVDLSNNYCSYISDHFFEEASNIETLLIQNNLLGFTLYNDVNGKVFEKLKQLKVINLSFNRIDRIPKLLFKNQHKLQVLNLSFNGLYKMELELSHMTHLQYMDLSNNQIENMQKYEREEIDQIKDGNFTVNLDGNRLECTCETLEFLNWLKNNEDIFKNFRQYQCRFSNYTNISFANIEETLVALKKSCDSYIGLIVGTVCAIMLVISLTIAGFVYRYRWKLRYLYYMAKGRYRGYIPVEGGNIDDYSYRFDAFISYCEQDCRFVTNDLLNNLENQSHLHVCLHQRDFMPGQDIAENITNAIHQSRKTVVILSESYLKSYWCMFEFNMARMESIYSRGGNSVLLLVFYENIAPKNLPLSLMDVIESKSYIEYPNDEQGNVVFWEKLAYAISK